MIGERLYELRKDAGLTQDELAAILNINKHSISSYERGKSEPPDDIKIEISKYFHVSVDYLLGITDNPSCDYHIYDVVIIPKSFPPKAVRSLRDYIDFLTDKYGNN